MGVATFGASGHLTGGQGKNTFPSAVGSPGTVTAFNAMLKEFYTDGVRDIINSSTVLLNRFNRGPSRAVSGKYYLYALNDGRNIGTQSIMEGVALPDPGTQQYKTARFSAKYHYGRVLFTGQAMSSSRSSRGAFLDLADSEMQRLARDLRSEQSRQLFGTGSGRFARVTAVAASAGGNTVITVADPNGITSQGSGTRFFEVGMRICFLNSTREGPLAVGNANNGVTDWRAADTTGLGVTTIAAIDPSASTITVTGDWDNGGGNGPAAGDFIYKATQTGILASAMTDGISNRGHEANGLAAAIDTGDPPLQRPTSTTPAYTSSDESMGFGWLTTNGTAANYAPRWTAFRVHNNGIPVPFSEGMVQQGLDGVDLLSGEAAIDLLCTTHGVRRSYAAILTASKRFVNTVQMPGGFGKALTYNEIPIIVDKDCSQGRMYGIDTSCFEAVYENDWDWISGDGARLSRLENVDAYQATMYRYSELACKARNKSFVIVDIQDA